MEPILGVSEVSQPLDCYRDLPVETAIAQQGFISALAVFVALAVLVHRALFACQSGQARLCARTERQLHDRREVGR